MIIEINQLQEEAKCYECGGPAKFRIVNVLDDFDSVEICDECATEFLKRVEKDDN